jgi:hypothetical protein
MLRSWLTLSNTCGYGSITGAVYWWFSTSNETGAIILHVEFENDDPADAFS